MNERFQNSKRSLRSILPQNKQNLSSNLASFEVSLSFYSDSLRLRVPYFVFASAYLWLHRSAILISTYVINIYSFKYFKLIADKLKLVPADLKKISDVVEKGVVKKDVYDEMIKKVNTIDTSKLVSKIDYNI